MFLFGWGTVTRSAFSGCLNWWWLPLVATKTQPYAWSFLISFRLLCSINYSLNIHTTIHKNMITVKKNTHHHTHKNLEKWISGNKSSADLNLERPSGRYWQKLRLRVFLRDSYQCQICNQICVGRHRFDDRAPECDHIIPIHKLPVLSDSYQRVYLSYINRLCS